MLRQEGRIPAMILLPLSVPRSFIILHAYSQTFRLFTGKYLTFHIGMELISAWGDSDEYAFNRQEFKKGLNALYLNFRIVKVPRRFIALFQTSLQVAYEPDVPLSDNAEGRPVPTQ